MHQAEPFDHPTHTCVSLQVKEHNQQIEELQVAWERAKQEEVRTRARMCVCEWDTCKRAG